MNIIEKLLNNLCLDERIENGIFDIANNDHISILRDYLVKKGISEADSLEFSNRVVEAGKYPDRQAYNKNGILCTFPTPQHRQNAIRRGTHFEKDPTKGKPNLFTDPETGETKKGPGRPRKDDGKKDSGEYTPPSQGGGKSITPTGDVSSLPVSGTDTTQSPESDDTDTTTSAPEPDGESGTSEPAVQTPPDIMSPKPEDEKQQDKLAIQKMMLTKNTTLGTPLSTT